MLVLNCSVICWTAFRTFAQIAPRKSLLEYARGNSKTARKVPDAVVAIVCGAENTGQVAGFTFSISERLVAVTVPTVLVWNVAPSGRRRFAFATRVRCNPEVLTRW